MTAGLRPDSSPADVVRAALAAHVAGEWPTVVSLADEESIAEWSAHFVNANTHIPTLEEMHQDFPNASADRLQSLVDGLARAARHFIATLPDHVANVSTLEELHALSASEILLRVFQAWDKTSQIARTMEAAYAEAGLPLPDRQTYGRLPLHFEVRREQIVDGDARVAFAEHGHDDGHEWLLRRRADGAWRILVRSNFLILPGARGHVVDDPVLIEYIKRQQSK